MVVSALVSMMKESLAPSVTTPVVVVPVLLRCCFMRASAAAAMFLRRTHCFFTPCSDVPIQSAGSCFGRGGGVVEGWMTIFNKEDKDKKFELGFFKKHEIIFIICITPSPLLTSN